MNYFDYQYKGNMGKIWSLFSDLKYAPQESIDSLNSTRRCPYSHTIEIINSAMNGNIYAPERFDLRGCQKQERINKISEASKLLAIVDESEEEEEVGYGYGEISSNKIKLIEDAYQILEDDIAFQESLKELYGIRSKYIVDFGIDPVELLKGALRGIPESIDLVKKLKDSYLKEILVNLCELGSDGLLMQFLYT